MKIKSLYLKQIYIGFLNEIPVLQMSYIIKIDNSPVYRKMLYRNSYVKSFHSYFIILFFIY